MNNSPPIPRVIARILIPPMLLYALYVQFHGEYGPGGGFQAGAIAASAIILYGLVFGVSHAQRAVPPAAVVAGMPLGVLIYGGVGIVTWALGDNYLAYGALNPDNPPAGQHLGIMLVELGVLVTVFSTMLTIFYAFTDGED
jgi:multicomponent Na+:H+ antiporter subunit B